MLCRGYRERLLQDIVAFLFAVLEDIREVTLDELRIEVGNIEPYEASAVDLHLLLDRSGNDVTRLKLVGEALHVLVSEHAALATYCLGNEEGSARLLGIEGCRVDLDIVDVLEKDVMLQRDREGVARDEESADTAGCEYYGFAEYRVKITLRILCDDAFADVLLTDEIDHGRVFVKIDVLLFTDILEKLRCDLLSGDVLVVENTGSGVTAFLGKIQVIALLVEVDVIVEEFSDDDRRLADHGIDRFSRVLIVTGTQSILEVVFVVLGVLQRGDTALGEVRGAVFQRIFCEHVDGKVFRQMQSAEEAGGTGTYDDDIRRSSGIGHIRSLLMNNTMMQVFPLPSHIRKKQHE